MALSEGPMIIPPLSFYEEIPILIKPNSDDLLGPSSVQLLNWRQSGSEDGAIQQSPLPLALAFFLPPSSTRGLEPGVRHRCLTILL